MSALQSKRLFLLILNTTSWMARRPWLSGPTNIVMRLLAKFTLRSRKAEPKPTLEQAAAEWQRMFPDAADHPIKKIENNTAYAEIRTNCPLRGTGDVRACYRLMQYDRSLMDKIGAEFVVLHSQAEPGRTHCEVAMRVKGEPVTDLTPAHERVDQKRTSKPAAL